VSAAPAKISVLASMQTPRPPAPPQPPVQAAPAPDTVEQGMLGLDLGGGAGSGFDLRMEDESPAPMPRPSEVTIIEMGEKDFGADRDLDIEGELLLSLQCPECGSVFKASRHDRFVKCDKCGLEGEIG
jgi:ribosomal protein S27AE